MITQIIKLIEDESFIEILINSDDSQKAYIFKKIKKYKYSEKTKNVLRIKEKISIIYMKIM